MPAMSSGAAPTRSAYAARLQPNPAAPVLDSALAKPNGKAELMTRGTKVVRVLRYQVKDIALLGNAVIMPKRGINQDIRTWVT